MFGWPSGRFSYITLASRGGSMREVARCRLWRRRAIGASGASRAARTGASKAGRTGASSAPPIRRLSPGVSIEQSRVSRWLVRVCPRTGQSRIACDCCAPLATLLWPRVPCRQWQQGDQWGAAGNQWPEEQHPPAPAEPAKPDFNRMVPTNRQEPQGGADCYGHSREDFRMRPMSTVQQNRRTTLEITRVKLFAALGDYWKYRLRSAPGGGRSASSLRRPRRTGPRRRRPRSRRSRPSLACGRSADSHAAQGVRDCVWPEGV